MVGQKKKIDIQCPFCQDRLLSRNDLHLHLTDQHPQEAHKLDDIMRLHQAKMEDSKLCRYCDTLTSSLTLHYRQTHPSQTLKKATRGENSTGRRLAAKRMRELQDWIANNRPLPPYPPAGATQPNRSHRPATVAKRSSASNRSSSSSKTGPAASRPVHKKFADDNENSDVGGSNFVAPMPNFDIGAAAAAANAVAHPALAPSELTFFEQIATLLKPTTLQPSRWHGHLPHQQMATFDLEFSLTTQQAECVALSRKRDPVSGRTEFGVQILLRCFRAEAGPQSDSFPSTVSFSVNSIPVLGLPDPLPCRPGAEAVRPGVPVDISSLCRVGNSAINRIRTCWQYRPWGTGHCLSVSLARVLTPTQLIQRMLSNYDKICSEDQSRRQIRQLLLGDNSNDNNNNMDDASNGAEVEATVAMTTLTASLRCPLSRSRIELPIRSNDCRHIQCFDARSYLVMNERKPTWKCPCCDKSAPFASLRVDALYQSVLADAPLTVEVVQFLDNGSWKPMDSSDTAARSASSGTAAVIELDDDETPVEAPKRKKSKQSAPCLKPPGSSSSSSNSSSSKRRAQSQQSDPITVVDLTADSD